MKIWVDADACPAVNRDILFRAAERTGISVIFVANRPVRIPPLHCIKFIQVPAGMDVADNEIISRLCAGDLAITGDIPLAARVIEKGGLALNPRGELYTADDIESRLSVREFMDTLRSSGIDTGGPPAMTQTDRQFFANQLDKLLTKNLRKLT